jgi:iron-sulfur cluster assembly protein
MITFTDKAINQFKEVIEKDEKIRIAVQGGGCSGMSYAMNFIKAEEIEEEDMQIDLEKSITVIIDYYSADILKNTTVDYIKTLQQSGFSFLNSDANTTCGCGSSFS